MKPAFTDTHKKILFHCFLWGIWLYLSLSNVSDDEFYDKTFLIGGLILTTHIPLFVLNTEWLIPKVLVQRGVTLYTVSLLVAVCGFILLHSLIFDQLAALRGIVVNPHHGLKPSKGVFALVLVAAISTGYGLLNYVVDQEKRQQDKQKERLQSELSFLRSQISPHFIFNILNSIVYLIRTKSDLAEPVTLKLSDLMRYMLYESENEQIALGKEISYLQNYIELQKVRFEEDVDVRFHVEGSPAAQRIEPMLLIPFVENAFKHGVGMVVDPIITVDLTINEQALLFSVINKITPETAQNRDGSPGIGLKNVQRRLELLYPEAHQLSIKNENGWFEVTLSVHFN